MVTSSVVTRWTSLGGARSLSVSSAAGATPRRESSPGEPAPAATLATAGPVDPELLQVFERCFNGGRVLRFGYTDRQGRRTRRRVEPHGLLVRAPLWYVIAWDSPRDAPRSFRMDRIRAPRIDAATFVPRPLRAVGDMCLGAEPLRKT
jgi:predicted DNA-binding transcriptional regulator YafY